MGGPSRREKDRITYIVSKKQASLYGFLKLFEIRLVKRKMVNFLKKIQMDLAEEEMPLL